MRATFPQNGLLPLSSEADSLAQAYLSSHVLAMRYANDASHVAICSVGRIEFLVSWNFNHLVNFRREAGFNAVSLLQGYAPVRIVSPSFLINGQKGKEV